MHKHNATLGSHILILD